MDLNVQFLITTVISAAECCCSAMMVIVNILLVVGIAVAYRQLKHSQETQKAQFLATLTSQWRGQELYSAVNYIHKLRGEWKSHPVDQWNGLAKKWVEEHAEKDTNSDDPSERTLAEQWVMRRTVSQFLTSLGLLLRSGYLTPDDVFGFIPEVGRLLAVLMPIERAIQRYWECREPSPIAEWDRPFGKLWFNEVWDDYQAWYAKRKPMHNPKPIDWSRVSSPIQK